MPCSFTILVQLANTYTLDDYELRESVKSIAKDLSKAFNSASPHLIDTLVRSYRPCYNQPEYPSFLALLLNYVQYGNREQNLLGITDYKHSILSKLELI